MFNANKALFKFTQSIVLDAVHEYELSFSFDLIQRIDLFCAVQWLKAQLHGMWLLYLIYIFLPEETLKRNTINLPFFIN